MAKKLKTYQTSLGFFDMAIAVPSMKAALEAWGAKSNLFHQGFAKEVDDPEVTAAAMAKPGVILRRPVGSDGLFKEQADLPEDLRGEQVKSPSKPRGAKSDKRLPRKIDDRVARKAALAYEKARKQQEGERRKREAASARERERRERAVASAEAAIKQARRAHEKKMSEIDSERAALEKRSQAEKARFEKQQDKLENALRRTRG